MRKGTMVRNDMDTRIKAFFMLLGEIAGSSLLLLLFWDFVMEEMFRFPNMTLFQAFCVVVMVKVWRHWL